MNHREKIEMREAMVKDFETLYLLRALEIGQDEFRRRLSANMPETHTLGLGIATESRA